MQLLFQECHFAHGNAHVLSEDLAFAYLYDMREKETINPYLFYRNAS